MDETERTTGFPVRTFSSIHSFSYSPPTPCCCCAVVVVVSVVFVAAARAAIVNCVQTSVALFPTIPRPLQPHSHLFLIVCLYLRLLFVESTLLVPCFLLSRFSLDCTLHVARVLVHRQHFNSLLLLYAHSLSFIACLISSSPTQLNYKRSAGGNENQRASKFQDPSSQFIFPFLCLMIGDDLERKKC